MLGYDTSTGELLHQVRRHGLLLVQGMGLCAVATRGSASTCPADFTFRVHGAVLLSSAACNLTKTPLYEAIPTSAAVEEKCG